MTEALIAKLGYLGIALLLVLGGLGLPVPEEAPIILAAVLSKNEKMWWPLAFASCFVGVLLGDFIVYFIGYYYGERVLSLPLIQRMLKLTREREVQIKGYFHRHGLKILILGRFAMGFRTVAYLTAGILKLPPLRLFLTDCFAASLSTFLMFGLAYVFAHQIQSSFDQVKHWLTAIVAVTLGVWILHRYYKGRQRAGLPVGPPVLVAEDMPLPPDDLHVAPANRAAEPVEERLTGTVADHRPRLAEQVAMTGCAPAPAADPTAPGATDPAAAPDPALP